MASAASHAAHELAAAKIITTDEVIAEFLTFHCRFGRAVRAVAAQLVRRVLANANVTVLPQSHESFLAGLQLSEARPDKEYSLTDCSSMRRCEVNASPRFDERSPS